MAFTNVREAANNDTATTASIDVSGLSIVSGELVVAYINRNDALDIDNDAGGTPWFRVIHETPSGETAKQALFWKIAGSSEPSTYSWTLNGNDAHQVIVKVATSVTEAVVDAAAVSAITGGTDTDLICSAIDGEVINDDAISFVFGGKDRASGGVTYNGADNSYTGVIGTGSGRASGGAHRIYTTGTTFSGDVTITKTGSLPADFTYSVHASFVESSAVSAVLTGTMLATVDEDDITTGGKTIIITLTGDTFKAAGTGPIGSTADTQALIDGFDAASTPTNGWNNEVRDKALTSEIVRTSSTIATWTVAAQAGYDISSQEVITGTIPVDVLVGGAGAVTATPTFTIDEVVAGRIMGSLAGQGGLAGIGGLAGRGGGLAR